MMVSDHARKRLLQRYPHLVGVKFLEEFESARPPTREQAIIIAARMNRSKFHEGRRLVSKSGIVFVVVDGRIVTLFGLPVDDGSKRAADYQGIRLKKPKPKYEQRRQKEKRWEKNHDD